MKAPGEAAAPDRLREADFPSTIGLSPVVEQDSRFLQFHMPDTEPLQVGGTDRYSRTVIHVVDKDVNAAPGVLVGHSALPYDIGHRGVCLE